MAILPTNNAIYVTCKSAQEIKDWFREEGVPIVAIADIAGVEKKSVYAWINGGPIRPQNQQRLEQLYNLLLDVKQVELINLYRIWNRQLKSGRSLGALLCEEQLNTQAIKLTLYELLPIALRSKKMTSSKDRKSKTEHSNPFLDEIREAKITDDLYSKMTGPPSQNTSLH